MPECIVPGCLVEATNNLGVRLRRPDTSAIWAPNSEAYVCDAHASQGARLLVFYEPTEEDHVDVLVHGVVAGRHRRTPVQRGDDIAAALRPNVT